MRAAVFIGIVAICGSGGCANDPATALVSTSGDEIVRRGRLLAPTDLEQLARPGSSVARRSPDGYIHTWTNRADGTFVAHTASSFVWGNGKWATHDVTYCIRIEWMSKDNGHIGIEKHCQGIYALDGKLFAAPAPLPDAARDARFGEIRFANP